MMGLVAISFLWAYLFAIIEGLHHAPRVWTCLGQQKVVLKNSTTNASDAINFLMVLIFLQVLHESWLCFIHRIWLSGVVKTARSRILLLTILLLFHEYHTIVLYCSISSLVARIIASANWSTSIRKLIAILFSCSLVERVGMTICSWLSSTTYCYCLIQELLNWNPSDSLGSQPLDYQSTTFFHAPSSV